jgi:hypothetical protein
LKGFRNNKNMNTMKNRISRIFGLLLLVVGLLVTSTVVAQDPPPQPPPEQGQSGNQVPGGGAPVGEGLLILTLLGAGYGAGKWYGNHKKKIAE